MVFAVHGLGDIPENFSMLFHDYPKGAHLVFPRGTIPWGRGYSWFNIRIPFTDTQPDLASEVGRAADQVAALIRGMKGNDKPVITGFSQGGMISFALAIRHPHLVRLSVPISGALPKGLFPMGCPKGAPPIRAMHGHADDIVPIGAAEQTIEHLEKVGCDAALEAFTDVTHTISGKMKRRLYQHLAH